MDVHFVSKSGNWKVRRLKFQNVRPGIKTISGKILKLALLSLTLRFKISPGEQVIDLSFKILSVIFVYLRYATKSSLADGASICILWKKIHFELMIV